MGLTKWNKMELSELYTDDKKSKYSSNPTKETNVKTVIDELFSKISNKQEISNIQFHHCEANIFLEKFA